MHTQKNIHINNAHEAEMKATLLEHWRNIGKISSSDIIVNEFTFNGLNRRMDLAILKENELIGVEIKSAADTLDRLCGQLEEYKEFFDKIYIFVCEKHQDKCLPLLSAEHELLVLKENKVKTVKRGRKNLIKNKLSYIKMMRVNELGQLVKHHNKRRNLRGRIQLEELALNLPKSHLRKNSFYFLRNRFSSSSLEFWQKLDSKVTIDNIQSLHRNGSSLRKRMNRESVSNVIKNGSWKIKNSF